MADRRIYLFRVWCQAENGYLADFWAEAEPDVCPHNPAHALDRAKTRVLDSTIYADAVVTIREEAKDSKTGGHFQADDFVIDVPAGQSDPPVKNISWPFPVSILAAKFSAPGFCLEDELEVQVAPGTVIGALTNPETAGAVTLRASSTVTANIAVGYWVDVGGQDCGRCLEISVTAGTIKVETALAADKSAGTLVKMTVKMMPRKIISADLPMVVGDSKIGGSYMPANTVIRVIYKNIKHSGPRRFPFSIELLY